MVTEAKFEDALERYESERPRLFAAAEAFQRALGAGLARRGLQCRTSFRIKSVDSIIAKVANRAVTDGSTALAAFRSMRDLVGMRLVLKNMSEYGQVEEFLTETLEVVLRQEKAPTDVAKLGYQATHLDVRLPQEILTAQGVTSVEVAEIQLRYRGEDYWAEVFHELGYKSEVLIPKPAQRRLTRLAGLLQVADEYADSVYRIAEVHGTVNPEAVLDKLHAWFLQHVHEIHDPGFSRQFASAILSHHSLAADSTLLEDFRVFLEHLTPATVPGWGKGETHPLGRQPAAILGTFLVRTRPDQFAASWAAWLDPQPLDALYQLQGRAIEDYLGHEDNPG